VLFVAASPGAGRAAAFWHPLRTLADTRTPVRLAVDRATVRRGDSVTVTIEVPSATRATLWTRGPGEPWQPAPVTLDSLGHARRRLGPLQGDLYLRASSGGRRSAQPKPQASSLIPTLPPHRRRPSGLWMLHRRHRRPRGLAPFPQVPKQPAPPPSSI